MARHFNETHFNVWMREVDSAMVVMCGLVSRDLDDQPYADWYSDGVSPKAAAKRAINRTKAAA